MRKLWLVLGIEVVLLAVLLFLSPGLRHRALERLAVTRSHETERVTATIRPAPRSTTVSRKRSPWEERSLEYFVWSEILSEVVTGDSSTIVVLQTPSMNPEVEAPYSFPSDFRALVTRLAPDAIASYFEKLESPPAEFERKFQLPIDYEVVTRKRLDALALPPDAWWDRFRGSYPEAWGWFRLSPLGLNQDGTQAFGYFEYRRDELWGRGIYVLAEKGQQQWKVKLSRLRWMS